MTAGRSRPAVFIYPARPCDARESGHPVPTCVPSCCLPGLLDRPVKPGDDTDRRVHSSEEGVLLNL